jgi:hypothetical protein
MTRNRACDYWADGNYCGCPFTRRYMNGWRCIKHTPAAMRKAANLTNEKEISMTTRLSNKVIIDGVPRFIAYTADCGKPHHFECQACGEHFTIDKPLTTPPMTASRCPSATTASAATLPTLDSSGTPSSTAWQRRARSVTDQPAPQLDGYITADGVHVVVWCRSCRRLHSHGHGGMDAPRGAGDGQGLHTAPPSRAMN